MHHHEIYHDDETFSLNVNGDFSGDVLFRFVGSQGRVDTGLVLDQTVHDVRIPFEVLEELVGRKYAQDAVSKIEQQSGAEYLKKCTSEI